MKYKQSYTLFVKTFYFLPFDQIMYTLILRLNLLAPFWDQFTLNPWEPQGGFASSALLKNALFSVTQLIKNDSDLWQLFELGWNKFRDSGMDI